MKAVGVAFVAGALGVLIGSLAAQPPREGRPDDRPGEPRGRVVYEGPVEAVSMSDGERPEFSGTVRVYDEWVFLVEKRQLVPRERVAAMVLAGDGQPGPREHDFGNDPAPDRPQQPDRPGRRPNTFREDQ